MAQRTVVRLTDDVDGSEATETVSFGLDGATYEIDLNDGHAADLREVMSVYVDSARRSGGPVVRAPRRASAPKPSGSSDDADPKAVRVWAEAQGIAVNARGRLKADVLAKYRAASK